MLRTSIAVPFLCTAALLLPAVRAHAESVDTDTTVNNLSAASPDYEIATNRTLTVNQVVDDVYSGTLSGSGAFKKTGDAILTFKGKFDGFSGFINLESGGLKIASGAGTPGQGLEILNTGTLIFDQSGDYAGTSFRINGGTSGRHTGILENVGAGTTTLNSASGSALYVRAGTLVFDGSADFDTIFVSRDAELSIGKGTAWGTLFGNVALETGAKLRFNTVSDTTEYNYAGTISGTGEVVFSGKSSTVFSADQTYTGTTTLNAGTLIFFDAKDAKRQIKVASPKITLDGGWLGGNAQIAGAIEVKGKHFPAGTSAEIAGGLQLGVAGTVLSVNGDVNFEPWQVEVITDSLTGTQTLRVANYGGATSVTLSENGTGRLDVAGTLNLAGTLVLSASGNLTPGQVHIFLNAGTLVGDFDHVVNQSEKVMLVSSGVMGVGENQFGIATIENRNLRARPAFREHNGLSGFVNYIAQQAALSAPHEVAQAVNLAMGKNIGATVNNFSPLPYCSLLGMGMRESNLETDFLRNIFRPDLDAPKSKTGTAVEKNLQFFAGTLAEFVQHNETHSTPIYDFNTLGAIAGIYTWIDEERVVGGSLSAHRAVASTHGYGGNFVDNALRARAFVGFLPRHADWTLLIGTSLGGHLYDINRNTGTGRNFADEAGIDIGAFVAFNYREALEKNYFFTPYARFDYNHVRLDTVRETGSVSALEIGSVNYNSFRARAGAGLEWRRAGAEIGAGVPASESLTLGCDFGIVAELGGDPKMNSHFVNYANSHTTISGTVEERVLLEISPRMNAQFNNGWGINAVWRFQCALEGSYSNAFNFGVYKRF